MDIILLLLYHIFDCLLFRFCSRIMNQRDWDASSRDSQSHFSSGVHMGIGSFNLMISMLPGRILKVLQFIGFMTNRVSQHF